VAYSSDETAVWSEVFAAASRLYPLAACPEFLRALPALGFTESAIPQLRDVSETLERKTGWQVRPVAGLMHPRDFLAGLAFKTFHSTQYTRHASRPAYTPVSLIFLSL
jgi:phenylalanine-4-hydroxylase